MNTERFKRQDFLGKDSSERIARTCIGIVGLGGGGSHIVQQLAHVGFANWVICDYDRVEESNLNRLVGATALDAQKAALKTSVAENIIRGVLPRAKIEVLNSKWQEATASMCHCDLIIGGVDTFAGRHELEAFCRQQLIPLIDIGLDVHTVKGEAPRMTGQVILSMPGDLCMHCLGFLTPEKLTREAMNYGGGGRPQVVWANGLLASAAVGLAVDLVTNWTGTLKGSTYLCYDANLLNLAPHIRWKMAQGSSCSHYQLTNAGAPRFIPL